MGSFTTKLVKGQKIYNLHGSMHLIRSVWVNDGEVEFKVVLKLKDVPKNYGEIKIFTNNEKLTITRIK